MPHGMCLLWQPDVFWTHVVADSFIALAYFSIPVALIYFAKKRPDFPYVYVLYLFGAFIICCGVTHLLSIMTLWEPEYGYQAVAKVVTAAVSVLTAILLWPLMPKAVAIPGIGALAAKNRELLEEVETRTRVERELMDLTESLEDRVKLRTQELTAANTSLSEEIELRKVMQNELLSARMKAEEANRAKTFFLANMSHELRSPLTAVIGFSELLQTTFSAGLDERQSDYVKSINTSSTLLLALINQLLDLSTLESDSKNFDLSPTSLPECLERARPSLETAAAQADIALTCEVADNLPRVLADQTALTQIIINLATNAIKYNRPGGGVEITVAHSEDSYLTLSVADTGPGIPDSYHESVFEPFNRLGQQSFPENTGKGIGLALSKRLAEAMNADLTFETEVGRGTVFHLKLHLA